jgi:hypothetical protein
MLTFIVTFCIYMFFALLDVDFGMEGLFGLFFLQPVMAMIFCGISIFTCFIIGLPIRLSNQLYNWWTSNYFIPIVGSILGICCLLIALFPPFREIVHYEEDGNLVFKEVPNFLLSVTGWLVTTFSILHTFPPRKLAQRFSSILN